jgi:hypothetical protein
MMFLPQFLRSNAFPCSGSFDFFGRQETIGFNIVPAIAREEVFINSFLFIKQQVGSLKN